MYSQEEIFDILNAIPSVVAASQHEIESVEQALGVEFPPPYRQLMQIAGRNLPSGSCLFPLRTLVQQRVENLAEAEADGISIPDSDKSIFFDEVDCYECYFFVADGCDDPMVHSYNFNYCCVEPKSMKLSEFLAFRLAKALGI
ncbi:MAG: SMI1/KNR4 family protein [Planctomycetota bacterium]